MEDKEIREELSQMLDSYEFKSMYGYSQKEKELKVLSWSQIFFEIGKLKQRVEGINKEVEDRLIRLEHSPSPFNSDN